MTGTLTVTEWIGLLSGAGSLVLQSEDGNEVVYVDSLADPTYRLVLTRDAIDPDLATFKITDPAGGATFAEADYGVSLSALGLAAQTSGAAALAVLVANLTDILLADGASADLETVVSGLTLTGNDEGTTFRVTKSAVVEAGGGNDLIIIGPVEGDGTIKGGAGSDTVSFANADYGVRIYDDVNLRDEFGGTLATWALEDIEFFKGSQHSDTFYGMGLGTHFEGGNESDYFEYFGPGTERDFVDYSEEGGADGVAVNFGLDSLVVSDLPAMQADLAAALVAAIHGEFELPGYSTVRDTYGNPDSVYAGFSIIGTARADFFYGSSDADSFAGGGGNDNFFGGAGDDTIDGGDGVDVLFFSGAQVDVQYADGVFTITSEDGGTDTVRGVEIFWFGETKVTASELIGPTGPTAPDASDDDNADDAVTEATTGAAGDATATGNVLLNDQDADAGDVLNVTGIKASGAASFLAVTASQVVVAGKYGSLAISGDGSWTYTLDNADVDTQKLHGGEVAVDQFVYQVSDNSGLTDPAQLSISITGTNDGPTTGSDVLAATYLEDQAITIAAATLLGNDGDVEGQTLSIAWVGGAQHGSVEIVGGNVVFTPDANYNGPASFTYKASDGLLESESATVSFTVTAQNDAPSTGDKTLTVSAAAYTFSQADFTFRDVDTGDALQGIVVVSLPTSGALKLSGAVVHAGDAITAAQIGQVTYEAPVGATGDAVASFSFKVSDGNLTSAAKTITFDVAAAANSAPVANNDSLIAGPNLEDQPIPISRLTLLLNDSDPDAGQTLSIASVGGAQHGSVAIVAGDVVFTPDANYVGSASFTYSITDGTLTSNTATVSLNILAVPDVPATSDRQVTIVEDNSYTFSSADFAFADVDAGDTLQSVKIVSLPGNGALTLNGAAVAAGQSIAVANLAHLVFTPSANANGAPFSSFSFSVSDGTLASTVKTFTLNVTAANDAPVAVSDGRLVTAEDTALNIAASVLLANDSDRDGDTLAIASVSSGVGGTALLNANGSVTFTPLSDFSGSASFSYRAKDASGALSDPVTVSLTVTPVNDAPVFTRSGGVGPSAALAFVEGTLDVYAVAATDIDSATITYSLEGEDADDFVISGGRLLFKAAPDFEAPSDANGDNIYRVTVVASDGVLSDRQELAISILDVSGNTVIGTKAADTIDLTHRIGGLGATDESDLIKGQAGKDTIAAAAGDDTLQGGAGKDVLDGGVGFDTADYSDKSASVTATLKGSSDARVRVSGANEDTIRNIEALVGGKAADKLTGDAGANGLSGGGGNDMLSGKAGHDTLTGGKGDDRFVFDVKFTADNADLVTDFKHGHDVIVLDRDFVKGIGASLSAGEFYGKANAAAAHDADDRIIYNKTTGDLFYDADGNKAGGKDAVLIATLGGHPTLDAGDFLIV